MTHLMKKVIVKKNKKINLHSLRLDRGTMTLFNRNKKIEAKIIHIRRIRLR